MRKDKSSRQRGLLQRIRYHYTGNAEGSTLRKTLGCLLGGELGIELRRVGSGKRMTFAEGEQKLSAWMADNAYVSRTVRQLPWELEDSLIATQDLPLNLTGNKHNQFPSADRDSCQLHGPGEGPACTAQSRRLATIGPPAPPPAACFVSVHRRWRYRHGLRPSKNLCRELFM